MSGSAARRLEERPAETAACGPETVARAAPPATLDPYEWHGFGSKDPAERNMALCEGLIDVSAALFNVSGREMRLPGRTGQGVTRVRQIAMYIAHTIFRLKMSEVGRCFGRDRTTVLHACQVVEDLRDEAEFEHVVSVTERVSLAAFGSRASGLAERRR